MDDDFGLLDWDNWPANLEQTIRHAEDGDEIPVPDRSVQALAESLKDSWYPDKTLTFVPREGEPA